MTFTPQEFEILNRAVAIAETLAKDTRCPLDWVAEAHEARLLLLGARIAGVPEYGDGSNEGHGGSVCQPAPQPFPHGRYAIREKGGV